MALGQAGKCPLEGGRGGGASPAAARRPLQGRGV